MSLAVGGDFYRQFSLNDTNEPRQITSPVLVDTNNSGIRITNAFLNLESLWQGGGISGIRLGMTMEQVVACWGKPPEAYSRCAQGLPTFFYQNVWLTFEGNHLVGLHIGPGFRLGGGLSNTSRVIEFTRVLGQPVDRHESESLCYLVFASTNAALELDFYEERLFGIWLKSPEHFQKLTSPR
jgi:hypothetical protein